VQALALYGEMYMHYSASLLLIVEHHPPARGDVKTRPFCPSRPPPVQTRVFISLLMCLDAPTLALTAERQMGREMYEHKEKTAIGGNINLQNAI
jgi:hypothetical protein